MFDDFKSIRTFPARTRVFRDGAFVPELSSEDAGAELPLHIIHIGKIEGERNWFIDMTDAVGVFFTARIEIASAAKIKLEVNANIENAEFDGKIIIKNAGKLDLGIIGGNNKSNTKIKCETKLFAAAGSENRMTGSAVVPANAKDAETDISFAALAMPGVKSLEMSPMQKISGIGATARHAASIYRPAATQIQYLKTAGLSASAATELLNRAFTEESD